MQSYSLCVIKVEKGPWNLKQRIGKGIDKYIPRTCLFPLLGLSTLQKKVLSNQNKGHLGSRYICLVMICCCPLQYLTVIPCSPYPSDDAQWLKFNVPSNLTGIPCWFKAIWARVWSPYIRIVIPPLVGNHYNKGYIKPYYMETWVFRP